MDKKISRKQMVDLLNEDLAREYQAIIAYVIYSQTIKGAEYQPHCAGARKARWRRVGSRHSNRQSDRLP
jgi:bacterioferritin (cytochrome b1)